MAIPARNRDKAGKRQPPAVQGMVSDHSLAKISIALVQDLSQVSPERTATAKIRLGPPQA